MKILKLLLKGIAVLALLLVVTCKKDSDAQPSLDRKTYNKFASALTRDLSHFSMQIRLSNSGTLRKENLKNISQAYYGKNSDAHTAFVAAIERSSQASPTGIRRKKTDEISLLIPKQATSSDLIASLNSQFEQVIANENIGIEDKHFLLTYITTLKVCMQIRTENQDMYNASLVMARAGNSGWWDSWGQCAAAIIGGAGEDGLTGFFGGAAAGSIIPGLGTGAGALIGGIGGAFFGGISAASGEACS